MSYLLSHNKVKWTKKCLLHASAKMTATANMTTCWIAIEHYTGMACWIAIEQNAAKKMTSSANMTAWKGLWLRASCDSTNQLRPRYFPFALNLPYYITLETIYIIYSLAHMHKNHQLSYSASQIWAKNCDWYSKGKRKISTPNWSMVRSLPPIFLIFFVFCFLKLCTMFHLHLLIRHGRR